MYVDGLKSKYQLCIVCHEVSDFLQIVWTNCEIDVTECFFLICLQKARSQLS
jgi:hypothetical protein